MKKLITLILLNLVFISCGEDPVSIDDKKVITDLGEYSIIYSYIRGIDDGSPFTLGVNTYNIKTKEISEISNIEGEYSLVNSPVIDNKIIISHSSNFERGEYHYMYDVQTGDSTNPFGDRLFGYNIKRFHNSTKLLLGRSAFQDGGPINTSDLDGSNITLIEDFASLFNTKLSHNGEKLSYYASGDSYLINSDGSNKQLLNIEEGFPMDWHPKDDRILFAKSIKDEDRNELFIYDINKKQIEFRINLGVILLRNAQYSPDGKKILIADKDWSVHLYNVETKKLTQVIKSDKGDGRAHSSECFSWTPDSRFALFLNPDNPVDHDFERGLIEIIDTETLTVEKTEIPDEVVRAFWYEN